MSRITLAIQCHHFQRRLCWMMSSLRELVDPSVVVVDLAFVEGNGQPETKAVMREFLGSVSFHERQYIDQKRFQYRGLVRNDQLAGCGTEWIMFTDTDMVYHPEFFGRLLDYLDAHKSHNGMFSCGRMSNDKSVATDLVNCLQYPQTIRGAFDRISKLKLHEKSNVGAGFCQIVRRDSPAHGGLYVPESRCRDWSMTGRGWNTRSDMQFRKRLNAAGAPRQNLPRWFTENVIHINHNRDPEAGHHITEQR